MAAFLGQNILITGASAGIGAAMAWQFAKSGANLLLAARRTDRLEKLATDIGLDHAAFIDCDVAKSDDMNQAVATMRERFGPVSIAVANAGFGVTGKLEDLTLDDYQRQFETNVFGVLRTVYAVLDDLKKTRGQLVIVGSVNGFVAFPGASAYAMSKFAVRALCDSLAHELSPYGITVTHVAPGFVRSEIRQVDNHGVYHAAPAVEGPKLLEISAEDAAKRILRAIRRRQREVVITGHGKVAVWMSRHCSWLIHAAMRLRARLKSKKNSIASDEESQEVPST